MPAAPVQTIDDYIALQPPAAQVALERVRRAIAKAARVPVAPSRGILAFRYNGRILLYFAGWKEHYSIYPANDAMVAALEGKLDEYRVSKGTLRFPLGKAAPVALIAQIAKFRVREMLERKPGPLGKTAAKSRRGA